MKWRTIYSTGGKHKACGPNPALHLVLSSPAPCFYPAAVPSSLPLVKEQLHLYSPNYIWPFEGNRENKFDTPGLQGINRRMDEAENQIRDLEYKKERPH